MGASARTSLVAIAAGLLLAVVGARAQPPVPPPVPGGLITLPRAVVYGLHNNPQLAAFRQQHGVAAASVVLARTYPFNPMWSSSILDAQGADVTNPVVQQYSLTLEVELFGQRQFRQQAAFAALTRADWEISNQEILTAVTVIRAFDAYLYQQSKLQVIEEFVRLNEKALQQVHLLQRPADEIVLRAEVNTVRAQLGQGRTLFVGARRDFYRALGTLDFAVAPAGTLDRSAPDCPPDQLVQFALNQRPDLLARQAEVARAGAQLRLERADRIGNLTVGPGYEHNETGDNFIGIHLSGPIPVFNRKQGIIAQREAEQMQALFNLRQTEIEVRQDVPAAITRVREARAWAETYRTQTLPDLTRGLADIEKLFAQGQPGVDVLRVLDVRRKLLSARDGYLDAQFAYVQALADLALAVGDPTLAMSAYAPAGR